MSRRSITMFARGTTQARAVAAVIPAGYNSALSRPREPEDYLHVAAKKPAKKTAKAVSKSKPAAKKPAAKKVAASKPAAKKTPARKPAAKQVAASKPVARKAAKPVVASKSPVKAPAKAAKPVAKKPAPTPQKTAPAKTPAKAPAAKPAAARPVAKAAVPAKAVATPAKSQPGRPAVDPKPTPGGVKVALAGNPASPVTAPRPVGKVAVAVAARPSAPAPRAKVKVVPYKTDSQGRPIVPDGYRPSPDEEYMGPLQVEYFRQRLMSWRADLVEESKQTIENLKDEVRDVGDEAERATRETENSLELRTRDRYRKLIGKIDSTLKRLDSGEYGYSVDSGEEIGLERLEARLTAERTIDEQERWEHLQKQIGD